MSKIKSLEQLVDHLSNESRIRKHELVTVRQMLPPATRAAVDFSLRLSPVMAYAHWEGYIREATKAYLLYLSQKSVGLFRLQPNFQAIACRSEIVGCASATKRIAPHLKVVRRLVDEVSQSVSLPVDAIDTESNLNWDVFENICLTVGVPTDVFWSEQRGLINDLFRTRCEIAHGQLLIPKPNDAVRYVQFALEAIQHFTTDLENEATTNAHLRAPSQ